MAKKQSDDRKVLVLLDCWAGKCGQVVELSAELADLLIASGDGDDTPAAVAAYQ